ncbi:hypothetical protein NG895_17670 [Aeoliella sp. ICT_H6.2]|uniref:Uncharacterized protein n=1 Tax=Aeoliella straminimaris TaxID=2954799 RepID=A0A9X2JH66_9BACT|nr:hypothetical protein [Aeoliella straminimaris]MCO6045730.1 hypothetical protein [Aeoliella straminimaris]
MSKTAFVEFRGDGFWAYDVALGMLFKQVIDHAVSLGTESDWLQKLIQQWRFNAVVADCGLYLDDDWSQDQFATVDDLLQQACRTLAEHGHFTAEEMSGWNILEGQGVFDRGHGGYHTAPVIELGQAIRQLLSGTLEPAPTGTWWLYGAPEGRISIGKRTE